MIAPRRTAPTSEHEGRGRETRRETSDGAHGGVPFHPWTRRGWSTAPLSRRSWRGGAIDRSGPAADRGPRLSSGSRSRGGGRGVLLRHRAAWGWRMVRPARTGGSAGSVTEMLVCVGDDPRTRTRRRSGVSRCGLCRTWPRLAAGVMCLCPVPRLVGSQPCRARDRGPPIAITGGGLWDRVLEPAGVRGVVRGHDPAVLDHRSPGVEATRGRQYWGPVVVGPVNSVRPEVAARVSELDPPALGRLTVGRARRRSPRRLGVLGDPGPEVRPPRAGVGVAWLAIFPTPPAPWDAVHPEPDVGDTVEVRVEDQPVGDPGVVGSPRSPGGTPAASIQTDAARVAASPCHANDVDPRHVGRLDVLLPIEVSVSERDDHGVPDGLRADRRRPVLLDARGGPDQRRGRSNQPVSGA